MFFSYASASATGLPAWRSLRRSKNHRATRTFFPYPTSAEILADAAYHAARSWKVAAIVVFTSSGSSARLISRYRPPVCIYAVTHNDCVARQLSMNYGVFPILAPEVSSTDEMLLQMDRLMLQNHLLEKGDTVVFVAGQPIGRPGTT